MEFKDASLCLSNVVWNLARNGKPFECMDHATTRWKAYTEPKILSDCKVCAECAYCDPHKPECWKSHLPRIDFKAKLKADMEDETVKVWLDNHQDVTLRTSQTRKEKIYLTEMRHSAPLSNGDLPVSKPERARKCSQFLGGDAYTNDGEGSPDPFIAAQIETLRKLNEVIYPDQPKLRRNKPTSLEDVKKGDKTTVKTLGGILTRTLDVAVPEGGKEVLKEVLRNNRKRHIMYLGDKGQELVDNMAHVYVRTVDTDIKDIILQQICAVLTRTEVNEHLRAVCKQRGMFACPLINQKKFKSASASAPKKCFLMLFALYAFIMLILSCFR
jgi:hypothetical protein